MISTETSKFKSTLIEILQELESHHGDKNQLMPQYINQRLNKSLETYYKEITKTFEYLNYRDENNLIKKYERFVNI